MAGNYLENGKLPFPTDREAFLKSPSAVIGDGDTVELPDAPVPHFHHEAELGLVIGKTSTDVPAEKAGRPHLRLSELHGRVGAGREPQRRQQLLLGQVVGYLLPAGAGDRDGGRGG